MFVSRAIERVRGKIVRERFGIALIVYPSVAVFHVDFEAVCCRFWHFGEVGPMPNQSMQRTVGCAYVCRVFHSHFTAIGR
jgi:hypothetical protein